MEYRNKSVSVVLMLMSVFLVALGATSCSKSSGDVETVRYALSHRDTLLSRVPMFVAQDKGIFKKHHVKVEFTSGKGGGTTLRLLSTGNADIAEGGLSAAIVAAKTDPGVELIGAWDPAAPSAMSWLGPGNLPADSVEKMKGVKLGYSHSGSASQRLAVIALGRAHLKNIKMVSVGGMGENWSASKSHVITAGWAMEPYISKIIQNEGAKIVFRPSKYIKHMYVEGIDVNKEFATTHKKAVQAIFESLAEAVDFMKKHPEKAVDVAADHFHQSRKVLRAGIKRYMDAGVWNLKIVPEGFTIVAKDMVKSGFVDQPIDVGTLLNQTYWPKRFQTKFK